jgi:hypothetical protein
MKLIIQFTRCIVAVLVLTVSMCDYVKASPANDTVEATMIFKVTHLLGGYGTPEKPLSDESFKPIPNARLIVIDRNGLIVANGLTDSNGEWSVKINTSIDPRFPSKKMSVVTVITVADGFNEDIRFDVPVNEHGDGFGKVSVFLRPIKPDARNEPTFDGDFHRFTVFDMLDYYAKQIGLVKQKQIQGVDNMPWSATLNP